MCGLGSLESGVGALVPIDADISTPGLPKSEIMDQPVDRFIEILMGFSYTLCVVCAWPMSNPKACHDALHPKRPDHGR